MNPYDPPSTENTSTRIGAASNPAKPLLYLIGGYCLIQGVFMLPVGMFVGLHVLWVCIAMLALGVAAIWLGYQRFDSVVRAGTIAWGVLTTLLILAAIALDPPSMQAVPAWIFIGLLILLIGSVPLIAVRKRAVDS